LRYGFILQSGWLVFAALVTGLFGFQILDDEKGAQHTEIFPRSWEGIWKGSCRAEKPGGGSHVFAMELHVLPTRDPQRMTWKLVYGEGEMQQARNYELITVDKKAGHFKVDEKNSIEIDAYLVGNALYSNYSVGNSLISVTYSKKKDSIHFDLLSWKMKDPVKSGGKEGIPIVSAYPLEIVQHAVLEKG